LANKNMKDLDRNLDNIREAKKFSMGYKIEALQQLILQRFQALTTISSISFAVAGIVISMRGDLIKNECLAVLSAGLFLVIAMVSLGRHLYLIRDDINTIAGKIRNLPDEDWDRPLPEKQFRADWWPETLYVLLVVGVVMFILSLTI
jgi:hypothetical protein